MRASLMVARPMEIHDKYTMDPGPLRTRPPMCIQLNDLTLLLDHFTKLHESLEYENIELYGVMFGVNDYFTLRDMADTKMGWSCEFEDSALKINGVKILLDPMRDGGAPVPVFTESEAIKVMSMRRKS